MSIATLTGTGFRVEPRPFAQATAWVAKHLPSKPTVPVLAGILLEYGDGLLQVSGFDWDTSASAELDIAGGGRGRVIVSGRLLAEVVKTLPDKPVDVQLDGAKANLTCGSVRITLPTMPVEDYPTLPTVPQIIGHVDSRALAELVERVTVAADNSGNSGITELRGAQLTVTDDLLRLTATDRYRIAVGATRWARGSHILDAAQQDILVPADVLASVARAYADTGSVDLATDGHLIAFVGGRTTTTSRLLSLDKSPTAKVAALMPQPTDQPARFDIPELAAAVKRTQALGAKASPVRITLGETAAGVDLAGADDATIGDTVGCEYAGRDMTLAFNPGYLLDALTALHGDVAELHITTAIRPVLITTPDDNEYRHVVVPIRIAGVTK